MKFGAGTSLQVIDEILNPPMGSGRMFGPFPTLVGKETSQMNFKVGAASHPGALGLSYRISAQGYS